jgi:hypothetical protein
MHDRTLVRRGAVLAGLLAGTVALGTAAAHGSSLGGGRESVSVPTWLFLATGGGAVGASFLLASFVTDRSLIDAVHNWRRSLPVPGERPLVLTIRAAGVVGLVGVVVVGLLGPDRAQSNAAVLFVWAGWWAGYTISTYLVGSTWTVLNPWRTLAAVLPTLDRPYPDRLGAWPSVVGLLALIYVEVVTPIASDPRALALVVLAYTAATLAGAVVFGPDRYFGTVDPVSRVFRYYGRVAPLTREDGRLTVRLPGTALSETRLVDGRDEVAFVVALLWGTTFDGFVATGGWRTLVDPVVGLGVPPLVAYLGGLAGGYALFVGVYWAAADYSRRSADTYLAAATLSRRFAPPLLAIAAGYHLAHYLGYFLQLSPALVATAAAPLTLQQTVPVGVTPEWFGAVPLASVLLGHMLAIWAAHATAFDLFAGRLQAIRSQYPYILVMVVYTMSSLWIVAQPTVTPPYV